MTATRFARRLGLDGNPLRRRADKFAACLAAMLVMAFLIGAPMISIAAVHWAGRAWVGGQSVPRSWGQVPAVPEQAAPGRSFSRGILGDFRVQARWTALDGPGQAAAIPVSAGMAAGHTVPPWLDAASRPVGPARIHRAVLAGQAAAAVVATAALGIVLLCLAWAGRWVLDRRRLANWEAAWAAVGPQWTKRFRSRG
jgi:hypothetical protein